MTTNPDETAGDAENLPPRALKPMLHFRWFRPARGDDTDVRLQQQWYDPRVQGDSLPIWRDVPTVLED